MALHTRWSFRVLSLLVVTELLGLVGCSQPACEPTQTAAPTQPAGPRAKNVIVLIGDGMGLDHVRATDLYFGGQLCFEKFPYRAECTTYSANSNGGSTDSAAAATAIATGHKVNNGVVSLATPGDGKELRTMLERARQRGKMTGLVTTVPITHATPACFGGHTASRSGENEIAECMLTRTRPNVLFGSVYLDKGVSDNPQAIAKGALSASKAGYAVVTNRAQLQALNTEAGSDMHVSGQFGEGQLPGEAGGDYKTLPHLSEMSRTALNILDNDPDGFFLMIEGGTIDWSAHGMDLKGVVFETREFSNTVQAVLDWAKGREDTLIIVTADHNTGGIKVLDKPSTPGQLPAVEWTATHDAKNHYDHSPANVGIWATGPGANALAAKKVWDNTDFFRLTDVP